MMARKNLTRTSSLPMAQPEGSSAYSLPVMRWSTL